MLDTFRIGLLRLARKGDEPYGYMRVVPKDNPQGNILSYFRIPIHVVFDKEGYNSYKEYVKKENPELKTWVHNITLTIPPSPEHSFYYRNAGHEWFLGNVRDLALRYPKFPRSLRNYVERAIQSYTIAKKTEQSSLSDVEDDYESPMTKAEKIAAYKAVELYGILQRSRFDMGRPNRKGEFTIPPFYREKGDKSAKELIEDITEAVSQYVWKNPKVSKYSETEGAGLKIKLTVLFLEGFYKEQIKFMRQKIEKFL